MTSTETQQDPASPPPRRGIGASIAALGAVVLLKMKAVLGLLKVASLGKFALTGLSMAAMVWFEALRGGFLFGLGFVVLILIHELGHGYAIRSAGLRSGWPVFIPFFGAMIALKEPPPNRDVEAAIAFGGPLWGTVASATMAGIYLLTGARIALSLGYTGFFLNLFNMIPIRPLDGGRVAQIFSKRAWILGGLLLGGMFLVTMAPQLILIGAMALSNSMRRGSIGSFEGPDATPAEQSRWSFRYFGLCFFLGASIYFTRRLLHPASG